MSARKRESEKFVLDEAAMPPPRRPMNPGPTDLEGTSAGHTTEGEDAADDVLQSKGSEDTAGTGGFLFVTNTGQRALPQTRQQLSTVRSHVMQNYLERTHAQQQGSGGENVAVARQMVLSSRPQLGRPRAVATGGRKMRFRLKSDGLELTHPYRSAKGKRDVKGRARQGVEEKEQPVKLYPPSNSMPGLPLTRLNSHAFDPFGSLAVQVDSKDDAFLYRFHHVDRYPWCPINGQSSWSFFALSDQLVFHATMFSSGMYFRNRIHTPDPADELHVIHHKLAAISLINDRLSDPEQATSDQTVAAVAALTNIAIVGDSFPEATKHMRGLEAIVNMRGGLSTLSSGVQQHLQRLISWNDLTYSENFDDKLRFPPGQVCEEAWGNFQHPVLSGSLPGLSKAELRAVGAPHHEVVDLLEDIRELCYAEQVSPLSRTDELGRMRRGDMFHRIERRLRVIVQGDTAVGSGRWKATVWRAVSLAAQIFTHHHLRGNPLKYRHFPILSTQLHDTLLTMREDLSEFVFAPALLIWMLSTGAVVTSTAGVHVSFVSMLESACVRYGLVDWERFRWTLSSFLWTGEADEKRYLELWQEVEQVWSARYTLLA